MQQKSRTHKRCERIQVMAPAMMRKQHGATQRSGHQGIEQGL